MAFWGVHGGRREANWAYLGTILWTVCWTEANRNHACSIWGQTYLCLKGMVLAQLTFYVEALSVMNVIRLQLCQLFCYVGGSRISGESQAEKIYSHLRI